MLHFTQRLPRVFVAGVVCALAVCGCDGEIVSAHMPLPAPPEPRVLPDIAFSVERGMFTEPFALEVTSYIDDATLQYTLDGSDPRTSPTSIQSPAPLTLQIDPDNTEGRFTSPAVIVRAVVMVDGVAQTLVHTHTFLFLDRVTDLSPHNEAPGDQWPAPSRNDGQRIDYGMDPDVYDDPAYAPVIHDALAALPSVMIATDLDNLFDNNTGIYMNALEHGSEWERPASFEILYADGRDALQSDSGLRIRGGYSRHDENPKHAFRLFFRAEYGAAKLRYSMFGDEGAEVFDKIDLRTSQNYSWSYIGDTKCTFNRDVFARDAQRDMGQPYTRSRYYHLYLDGVYWGLYQTQERSEASFAATYFGGDADDYDVIKVAADEDYVVEATDGTLDAWREVFDRAQEGFIDDERYFALEGRNESGDRDVSLPVWVNIDSLIDYMLIIFYTGNIDAPVSKFLSNQKANNFYAIRNSAAQDKGFMFFAHDSEHTLFAEGTSPHTGINENRVNIGVAGSAQNGNGGADDSYLMRVTEFSRFQPQWLHQRLSENALYRSRFAERAKMLLEDRGALTSEAGIQRFQARADEIEVAVVAESARWGDAKTDQPRTRDDDWQPAIDAAILSFFPRRSQITIEQLRAVGLY